MRVLHVVPSYLPAVRYGGTTFATHAMCAALARRGCEVTVYTTTIDGPSDSNVPVGTRTMLEGVSVWYFRARWPRRLYFAPMLARTLAKQIDTFDLLHLHSVFLWPTWAAARWANRAGIPYLLAPRGMLVRELVERKSRWIKSGWIGLIERKNLERAVGIHVTSDTEAAELRRFGFDLPPLYEVANGVESGSPPTTLTDIPQAAREPLERGLPVVLYLGRINWKKGLDRLITAIARLQGVLLLIVGNDEERYTPKLASLAIQAGIRERVFFSPPVYGRAKTELFAKAAMLVLPSYSENFGNVVLEAMAQGCPVVVTPGVGASKIVAEEGGGLVVEGDPVSFSGAIQTLLSDKAIRKRMASRTGELQAKFSWDAAAEKMLEVYSTCSRRSPRSS